jgi:hypothetical protein
MTPEERKMRVPHVCTIGCQIAPTDHWPADDIKLLNVPENTMERALEERLVTAFERIANALDRIAPIYQWTIGGLPTNPPYVPPTIPYSPVSPTTPYQPLVVGTGNTNRDSGQVRCINAMTQADGMGDDSGTRGD